MGYESQKRYRTRHPEVRKTERKAYYNKSNGVDINSGTEWSSSEDDLVCANPKAMTNTELAKKIGRSIRAIHKRRCLLTKVEQG